MNNIIMTIPFWLFFISHLSSQQEVQQNDQVYRIVEEAPRFPGCESVTDKLERSTCSRDLLLAFLSSHKKCTDEAKRNEVNEVGVVVFVVEKSGQITNIEVTQELDYGLNERMIDAIEQMNTDNIKWIPAFLRGDTVRAQFNCPIKFDCRQKQ